MGMGMHSADSMHVYDRARGWRDQLINIDVADLKEKVGVTSNGRDVLVLKDSESGGWLSSIPGLNLWYRTGAEASASGNSMLKDVQLMQRRVAQLNDMYHLKAEEGPESQSQSISTGTMPFRILWPLRPVKCF
ncbi:MAG: hypothetical protein ACR2PX_25815 [Endozoicomonas sp.]|uniref:hypothetical protein n=1 Tax=Endozoicomonas sp. TaxID=1892382 RepID=UPI003D9BC8D0